MRDFPVFTTENGAASLTLRQIPYRGDAYIRVRSALPGCEEKLVAECADFCRIAGASRIWLEDRQAPQAEVWELRGVPGLDPEKVEHIFPVTRETVGRWRAIVNERLRGVDLAGALRKQDEETILQSGGAYFVHRDGTLLGVGWLDGEELRILAGVVPGMGERVAATILSVTPGQSIRIEVASTNERALRLYEKLGFLPVASLEGWRLLEG